MNVTVTRLVFVGTYTGFVVMCKDSWLSHFLNTHTLIPWPQLTTTHLITLIDLTIT